MWANGDGEEDDDCGADGYASSIYTISVGGIGVNGSKSPFDERCSSKFVVTYVTNDLGKSAIVSVTISHSLWFKMCVQRTTNDSRGCLSKFGGTSAATPMVAGGVALALEAKLVNVNSDNK